jgi:hypothetical protein
MKLNAIVHVAHMYEKQMLFTCFVLMLQNRQWFCLPNTPLNYLTNIAVRNYGAFTGPEQLG